MGNKLVTGNRFYPAAFQVVIAAVEHFARVGQFLEIASHGVLNQLVWAASGFGYPTVELRLQIGVGEVYVHDIQGTRKPETWQDRKRWRLKSESSPA